MKRYISFLIVSLLAILICSCAQWGGDTPLGITGGGSEGYGKNNDLNLPDISGGVDPELVGSWSTPEAYYYAVFTFNADGTFSIAEYYGGDLDEITEGTWSVSGSNITLTVDGYSEVIPYSINGDILTVDYHGDTVVLHRRIVKRD